MGRNKRNNQEKVPVISKGNQPLADRTPRINVQTGSDPNTKPLWAFVSFDKDGSWGYKAFDNIDMKNHLKHLSDFESMTWREIDSASGGRSHGTNNHPVKISNLSTKAQKRLSEIKQDDLDQLYSLRLCAGVRIYGIRKGNVLRIIWFDPWHKEKKRAVYPTKD